MDKADNFNPYYDADMQNKLIKLNTKKEIRTSVLYGLAMIAISYFGSTTVIFLWQFFTAVMAVFSPIEESFALTSLVNMAAYVFQLGLPVLFYLLFVRHGFGNIFFTRAKGERSFEKVGFFGTVLYFVFAFSLSQIFATLGSFFSSVISELLSLLSEGLVLNPSAFAMEVPETTFDFLLNFVAIAILPAILEEILFRGVFLGEFLRYGKTFGIVMSAFFFASVHGSVEQMIFSFIYGIIFGYIAVKTGSIFVGMLIHFLNNAYSCTVEYLGVIFESELYWNIISAVNLVLITVGLIVAIVKAVRGKIGYVEKKDSEKEPFELSEHEKFSVFASPCMLIYYVIIAIETLYVYISYHFMV